MKLIGIIINVLHISMVGLNIKMFYLIKSISMNILALLLGVLLLVLVILSYTDDL